MKISKFNLAFLALSLNAFGQAPMDLKEEETRWAPTELRPLFLDNTMSESYCSKSSRHLMACAAGVEAFAGFKNRALELTLIGNEFTLKEGTSYELSFLDYQNAQRKKLKSFISGDVRSLMRIYQEQRTLNQNPKPHEIALALNQIYAVLDGPHKFWKPMPKYNGLSIVSTKPNFGAEIQKIDGKYLITSVIVGGQAEKSGLKPNDEILEVNKKSIEGAKSFEHEANQIVGLKIKREGREFTVYVRFGYFKNSPLIDRKISDGDQSYSYLSMAEIPDDFDTDTTCSIVKRTLDEITKKSSGLILDLRNNSNGPHAVAACIAGLFLGNLPIYLQSDMMDLTKDTVTGSFYQTTDKKLITLINARTSGAAEVLAGALQFHGRSLLIGDRTSGRGIVIYQEDYKPEHISLMSAGQKVFLPDGRPLHINGITPDLTLYSQGQTQGPSEKVSYREEDIALFPEIFTPMKAQAKPKTSLKEKVSCIDQEKVKSRVMALGDSDWRRDYQIQAAVEGMSCL